MISKYNVKKYILIAFLSISVIAVVFSLMFATNWNFSNYMVSLAILLYIIVYGLKLFTGKSDEKLLDALRNLKVLILLVVFVLTTIENKGLSDLGSVILLMTIPELFDDK
ncbi:hypothetical protein HMPREF2626_01525 [Aerococcus sp. HMSC062A02]|uniref:hypothetical protein n=1 Tax=Aerococcus sp. HMSC062A02 TaxID=1715105 RepID=UPI0008A5806E|nr:hypothetical protein [Aerococcus sp. HMSC062A02]OFN02617.1 hypothetical protein HMPREF2626_01525 [Aerococcus sp. HMSC062A02]